MAYEEENNIQEKKSYEIGFLIKEEKDVHSILDLLKRHGAEVNFEGPLKKLLLSYKIKNATEADFGDFRFTMDAGGVRDLNNDLKQNVAVLRFLIIHPAVKTTGTRTVSQRSEVLPRPSISQPESSLPLSNEALEKKIEEILK